VESGDGCRGRTAWRSRAGSGRTHARIEHLGIDYREANRARIEAACARAELQFARRLPAPGGAIEDALAHLNRHPGSWTDQTFARRELRDLREIGVLPWIVDLLARRRGVAPGLTVRCTPQPGRAVRYSEERSAYVWSYRTEVRNDGDVPVRVASFAPLVRQRLRWRRAGTSSDGTYGSEEFSSWYGAPDDWIEPGETVACERTGSWRAGPHAWRVKWWYGAHDAEGNWYTGETALPAKYRGEPVRSPRPR
jgi:hypothetical protein